MTDRRAGRAGWAVLLALAAVPAVAAPPIQEQPAPLDLSVNGRPAAPVLVVIRDGDVLVSPEDLARAGLRGFEGRREVVGGRELVSLRSLHPSLEFVLDERALVVRVTAGPGLLPLSHVDLRASARPPGLAPSDDATGFVNYSARVTRGSHTTGTRTSAFAEAGASKAGRLLYSSGQVLDDGRALRGVSSLTLDDAGALRRVVVGDASASSTALGATLLLGGVSVAREFGLDPYLVRSPLPRITGFASTPSTLDVYVNGVLTRQVPLAPGGYDVSNLPVTTGSANVQTVLRDAFGRTEQLDWRGYYSAGLLARGLTDYGYALGFRRLGYGVERDHYGKPVLAGRHRLGVSDQVTAGGRLDGGLDLVSGGPSLSFAVPVGTLELEGAGSREGQRGGAAVHVSYGWVSARLGAGAMFRWLSPSYAHAGLGAGDDRPLRQASVYVGAPLLPRVSGSASYGVQDFRDAGLTETASLRTDVSVPGNVTVSLSGQRTRSALGGTVHTAFLTLVWAVAPSVTLDATGQAADRGGRGGSIGAQKALPVGPGVGGRARVGEGPGPLTAEALLQGQWSTGYAELQYDRVGTSEVGSAQLSGGAVVIGDRLFLTRPVQDGFGLIRAGAPGVRGYAEGQEIGRTDSRGDLLVPTLIPYYGNRLSIADRDVPLDWRVGAIERHVAPRLRGGAVARFPVERLRTLTGTLRVAPGPGAAPAYGDLAVAGLGPEGASPVGGDGTFYLESLPPGRHEAVVTWSGGRCRARLVVPADEVHVDLGPVTCERELPEQGELPPPPPPPPVP